MQNMDINVLFMGNNFERLLIGLWVTVRIALIAVALSIPLGILMGVLMNSKNKVVRVMCKVYLETVRIMPQLVLLFIFYFGITKAYGINIPAETSAIIVFTFWGTAEMGDLVRNALSSIPVIQYESGKALGMSNGQVYFNIILPQTVRRLVPLAINLTTRMIKTTSLVSLIGIVEVIKVGKQIIDSNRYNAPTAALWIYGVIFILYFIVCFLISKLAGRLEKRWQNY